MSSMSPLSLAAVLMRSSLKNCTNGSDPVLPICDKMESRSLSLYRLPLTGEQEVVRALLADFSYTPSQLTDILSRYGCREVLSGPFSLLPFIAFRMRTAGLLEQVPQDVRTALANAEKDALRRYL